MKRIIITLMLGVSLLLFGCGSSNNTEELPIPNKEEVTENKNDNNLEYKLQNGKLLDVSTSNNKLIIKAKIEPSFNNKATINQNGFNIEDLILNQGADSFDEIQYWAVADMESGSEDKVISFTVSKENIERIKNKELVGNKIVSESDEIWILPSLEN